MIKIIYRVIGIPILQSTNIPEVLQVISLTGMIFGSVFAIAQTDVKRMLAYSSVAQLGYIFLGIGLISSLGLRAALFQIFSHGIIKVALFLAAGVFIYLENKRIIKTFAGLGQTMPLSLTVFSLGAVAMVGIPLTSAFISKLYLGVAVMENNQYILLAGILFSSLLNLIYYLPIVTTGFLSIPKTGYVKPKLEKIPLSMLLPLIVLGLLIVGIGIFPNPLTQLIDGAVAAIIN
jgi:multicomponent Na+:H+ antiporter subunit D